MPDIKPRIPWDDSKSAAENARLVLPKLTQEFFRRGRQVVESSPSTEDLHQFRLSLKRFRYTLELFRPCYGTGLEQRLNALKQMQEHLGAMNDCEATSRLIESTVGATENGEFLAFLKGRCDEQRLGFLSHWRETFDAPGQEAWWVNYLSRPETIGSARALDQSDAVAEPAGEPLLHKTATG
jgi:CHAD domain-containing protein